jgi:hypothetical protein
MRNGFYHFNVSTDPKTGARTLTEGGTVYNEEQTKQPEANRLLATVNFQPIAG